MARRKKHTPLEEEIWAEWHKTLGHVRGFPVSEEEYDLRAANDKALYDSLLARAYVDGKWLVNNLTAHVVATSVSRNAIQLDDWARAQEALELLLTHPQEPSRGDKAEIPTQLYIARLANGDSEAVSALKAHIYCGIYRDIAMAKIIAYNLLFVCQHIPASRVADLSSVISELAKVRKSPKRLIRTCESIESIDDAHEAVAVLCGFHYREDVPIAPEQPPS